MRRILTFIVLCLLLSSCREMVEKEADEKLALAESALRQGEWAAADESFRDVILLDPERPDAWIGRGMTLTQLGEKESARKHYEEALLLYGQKLSDSIFDPVRARHRVMLLVLLGRSEEATALAHQTAEEHADLELARNLPSLVKELEQEFAEMILPVDEQQTAPILKSSSLTGSP